MRKTYQMILALLFSAVGAMNVSADEISLNEVPFWQHESGYWGLDEPKNTQIEVGSETCAWVLGEATGQPYGDNAVNSFADLSAYTKLVVTLVDGAEGSPRFLFNRDMDEGQWDADEAASHLIDNTRGGWSGKYFSQDGNVYTVDLKQMVKDKGFAYLHAIKGANWSNVTVESMVVVSAGKAQQIGWVNLINNSSMEDEDNSSFFTRIYPDVSMPVPNSEISDGVGVDGGRGIVVEATAKAANAWDNQFWFRFNEVVPVDAKYRVSFDYRADMDAKASTQSHAEPGDYIYYQMLGDVNFTTDWQHFTMEGTVTADQAGPNNQGNSFQSIAFNLSEYAEANNYYFDNIKFEVYKAGTTAEFSNDVILIDYGFDTNMAELVKATGAKRVFFDNSCATVKVNGKEAALYSIEGLEDGRLYIFLEDAASDGSTVEVSVAISGLVYTSGPNIGQPVPAFNGVATHNYEVENEDVYPEPYPYDYVTPTVMKADPEDGSFNLDNNVEFNLHFDKEVDGSKLQATINGKAMTVSPQNFSQDITLSAGSLSDGNYTVKVTKIYPKMILDESIYGEYEYTVNVGEVVIDPNDQPYDLYSPDNFTNCSAGYIPDGFSVKQGDEIRIPGNSYGSGSRMFDFAAGGDFTKGLYFREGYAQIDPYLPLSAGRKYIISFNSCMWKDNGSTMDLKVLTADEEEVFSQAINNTPNVNGSTAAVSGSTKTEISFVPANDGDYIIRWDRPGFNEVIIANVKVSYMPNSPGMKETLALQSALEEAQKAYDENSDERYQGTAWENLASTIAQYTGWKSTSPSAYQEAIDALNAAALALKDHRTLCDEYDKQIKAAIDVVRQNASNKFANTALYQELVSIVSQYNGTSQWVNIGDEENEQWELNYSWDVLKDDNQLTAAVAALKDIATTTSLLFTEGASEPENANGGKGTGVAVLIDRLRLGVAAAKSLGAEETHPTIVAAENALTDDDEIANGLKRIIKQRLYGQLKDGVDLFEGVLNEETLEEETPTYDMTVFVKNPNIYKQLPSMDVTEENVPGWITPDGYNKPGLTVGWGQPKNVEGVAEDCMFQTWGGQYRVEQTIYDLPAGIYSLVAGFGERNDDGSPENSHIFAMTSDGVELIAETPIIGQAFPFASQSNAPVISDIEVTDGELTIGATADGDNTHTFFNEVRLLLTAPASVNYADLYAQGIETLDAQGVKARSIQLFDLNGRRIDNARQGVVIKKKTMSDGTVITEKVVRK